MTTTASPSPSKFTPTTSTKNLGIQDAIRHWASHQVFLRTYKYLEKKVDKMSPTTPSTTQMATTLSSGMTTSNPKTKNLGIHDAIRHWASQPFQYFEKKIEKMSQTTPSTTQMAPTLSSAMSTSNPKTSTKVKNLLFHYVLRP